MRSGVKPDLAHVGGTGTTDEAVRLGLTSLTPDGMETKGVGTSYASPLVAKTAAVLDHSIEGETSRETLIALLIHHAQIPESLRHESFTGVIKDFIGFGLPPPARDILETEDHTITLVFCSHIQSNQEIHFAFDWPSSLVGSGGKCRGEAKLTLVYTPPLDKRFGSEFVRINLDAALQQKTDKGNWKGYLKPLYLPPRPQSSQSIEADRIKYEMKWSPVKKYSNIFPEGVGKSSQWRLFIKYLTRSEQPMPHEGIPFTAILTIKDPENEKPVFNEMRQSLLQQGTEITSLKTAGRITPKV